MKKGEPNVVKNFGGKVSLSNFPEEQRIKILNRLAEKDEIMERGLKGELPGILIDGKKVTRENIHEFEISKKVEKEKVKDKAEKQIDDMIDEVVELEDTKEIYKKEDLQKLSMKELKKIGKKFGTTDRSKKNLIKEILKLQK
ncbi:MAG: hypothetical protein ACFFG0_03070 [Candidatus Thorarchaeota archaeon]